LLFLVILCARGASDFDYCFALFVRRALDVQSHFEFLESAGLFRDVSVEFPCGDEFRIATDQMLSFLDVALVYCFVLPLCPSCCMSPARWATGWHCDFVYAELGFGPRDRYPVCCVVYSSYYCSLCVLAAGLSPARLATGWAL